MARFGSEEQQADISVSIRGANTLKLTFLQIKVRGGEMTVPRRVIRIVRYNPACVASRRQLVSLTALHVMVDAKRTPRPFRVTIAETSY